VPREGHGVIWGQKVRVRSKGGLRGREEGFSKKTLPKRPANVPEKGVSKKRMQQKGPSRKKTLGAPKNGKTRANGKVKGRRRERSGERLTEEKIQGGSEGGAKGGN